MPLSFTNSSKLGFLKTIYQKFHLYPVNLLKEFHKLNKWLKVIFQNIYREDGTYDSDLTSEFLSKIPCIVPEEELTS